MDKERHEVFSRADRDLLITLNTKFDNLSADVKLMSDSFRNRVRDLEVRVTTIERDHTEVNPAKTYERFVKVEEGYKRIKIIIWFLGAAAVIISWTTGTINQILTLFHK